MNVRFTRFFFYALLLIGFANSASAASQKSCQGNVPESSRTACAKFFVQEGWTALLKKDYQKSIDSYSEAIRLQPGESSHYVDRGQAYQWSGDNVRALAEFTQAIRINDSEPQAYNYRAKLNEKMGRKKEAIADYKKAMQYNSAVEKDARAALKRLEK